MKENTKIALTIGFLIPFVMALISMAIITNIYLFLDNPLHDIFMNLNDASIISPVIIPFIIIFLVVKWYLNKKNKVFIIILVLIYFVLQIYQILFSYVNGICFLDVLISLINNIGGLGL